MAIHFNTRVYLKNKQVLIRVKWLPISKGKYAEVCLSCGVSAEEQKWNHFTGRAQINTIHNVGNRKFSAKSINTSIEMYLEHIKSVMNEFSNADIMPCKEEFKQKLYLSLGKNQKIETDRSRQKEIEKHEKASKSFGEIFSIFMQERAIENNWGEGTHFKYEQCRDHILKSCGKKGSQIKLTDFDKTFLNNLKAWYVKKNYSNYTIQKHFRNLRAFIRWAKENGYAINEEALYYKLKVNVPHKVITFLYKEELEALSSYTFDKKQKHLERTRDAFCFCCYTSLRFSDIKQLKWSNIVNNEFIEFYTIKTKDLLRIPLIPEAKALLEKYKEYDAEQVFPIYSNQKMNDYLKEVAEIVGLNRTIQETIFCGSKRIESVNKLYKTISWHDARRTFVCTSLSYGIPPSVVQKITGHSSLKAMQPYVNTDLSVVASELKKWSISPIREEINTILESMNDENELKKLLDYIKNTHEKHKA